MELLQPPLVGPFAVPAAAPDRISAGASRNELRHYTDRLMHALGDPPVVFSTHGDDYATKSRAEALKGVDTFIAEVHRASPKTRVIVPDYFTAIELR